MPRMCYVPKTFTAAHRDVIDQANAIVDEYREQGFILTLRQLYYQFVARALIENKQSEYKRLGAIINDARLAGVLDWNAIEDRTRFVRENPHWETPAEVIASARDSYRIDVWATQPYRPEVWIEKDALIGVIERVCRVEFDVPYFSCRGYTSQSEQWRAGKRMTQHAGHGQKPIVFHLGDHDPSGVDMTRDNSERLGLFLWADAPGVVEWECRDELFTLNRLALNMDQIERYNPPPNPAKLTDSRSTGYIAEYGSESWELDALDPPVIAQLIRDAINGILDEDAWAEARQRQESERMLLGNLSERWDDVRDWLEGQD